mmetsp:Transcript_25706/g.31669  ORF Transcript_25706/g.31669 Transcript_25706/m.31669 type:complete len:206 (+) Transcript_25706:278-895(+)
MNSSGVNLFSSSFLAAASAAAFFSASFLCFSSSFCSFSFKSSAGSASFHTDFPPVLSSRRIPSGGSVSSRNVSHSCNTPLISFARAFSRTVERKSIRASNTGVNFSSPSEPPPIGNPISTPAFSGIRPNVLKIWVTYLAAFLTTRLTGVAFSVSHFSRYKLVALTRSARAVRHVGVSKSSFNASSTAILAISTDICSSLALTSHL